MDGQRTTTNAVTNGGKDRTLVLVLAAAILPAAFLFSSVAALPHVFLITLLALGFSVLVTKPLRYSDRSLIYSFVAALVLAVLLDMVFPMKQDRFFPMSKLFMANISVPVVLYLAVFATYYQSNPYTIGFSSSLSIIALMLCANYQLSGGNEADLPFISTLLDHFKVFYVSVVAFDTATILVALHIARKSLHHKSFSGFDWRKGIAYLTALLIAVMSTYTLFTLSETYRNEILRAEAFFRKMRLRNVLRQSKTVFGGEVDLRYSMNADRNKNKNMVMLRVAGKNPPGYMRGRVYQFYRDGRWTPSTDEATQMRYRLNIDGLAVNAFFKDEFPGETGERIDIYPTSACVADFLFLPGNTIRIDTVADRIGFTKNGFFKPKTWEPDGGYTVRVEKIDQLAAYPHPTIKGKKGNYKYMQTPSELDDTLNGVLETIAKEKATIAVSGDRLIVKQVEKYFLDNFEYTLSPKGAKDQTDPVEFFLMNSKRGHCELFASAAVLLLRQKGIPARYVTGLLCFERHPSQDYFVSRLANAHAWVEAYLRDEKKWVLVEPTPPSAGEFHTSFGTFEAWGDRLSQLWRKTFAGIRRGYVARSILAFFTTLFGFLFDLVWHPIRGLVVFVSALFLFCVWRKSSKRKRGALELSPEIVALSAKFAKLLKKIQKRLGEPKLPHESLEEWCARIADKLPANLQKELSDLLRAYNSARFSGETPQPDDILKLDDLMRDFHKNAAKLKRSTSLAGM